MTNAEKILARAAGKESVVPGDLMMARLDLCLGNDVTAGVAIDEFEKAGFDHVFDPERIGLIPDHFTPNKDIKSAGLVAQMREFSKKHGIVHYYGAHHPCIVWLVLGPVIPLAPNPPPVKTGGGCAATVFQSELSLKPRACSRVVSA